MTKFFKDIMLEEPGVYTLLGSKPVTEIPIYYFTQEEVDQWYNSLSEEEKKKCVTVNDYDLAENWEKWERIKDRFPATKYLFFKTADKDNLKVAWIRIVNILQTALLLEKNYEIFRKETGQDFDPLEVIFEMEKGSGFWDKVFDNSALVGMLFGYGFENSFCFQWKHRNHSDACKTLINSMQSRFSENVRFGQGSLKEFRLPVFATFSNGEDEIIEKYKMEREKIKQAYRDKDFLDFTLQKLTE